MGGSLLDDEEHTTANATLESPSSVSRSPSLPLQYNFFSEDEETGVALPKHLSLNI